MQPGVTITMTPDNESNVDEREGVLQIWENLPSSNKALSIASVILYMFTTAISLATMGEVPWYITMGFVAWPLLIVVWLVVIWVMFAILSIASVLFQGKISASTARSRWILRIVKTIIFIPTVIGSALAVVDVFANEIFTED